MAAVAVTNTFVNTAVADATEVNTNFTDLVAYINGSVIRVDGTNPMAANLAMGTNRITGLGAAAAGTDAMSRDAGDARWTLKNIAHTHPVLTGSVGNPNMGATGVSYAYVWDNDEIVVEKHFYEVQGAGLAVGNGDMIVTGLTGDIAASLLTVAPYLGMGVMYTTTGGVFNVYLVRASATTAGVYNLSTHVALTYAACGFGATAGDWLQFDISYPTTTFAE